MALACILHMGMFLGFPSVSLPRLPLETWPQVVEAGLTCLGAAFDPGLTLLSREGTCLLSLSFYEAFKYM